jgi:sugar lactone lactonase YvrE
VLRFNPAGGLIGALGLPAGYGGPPNGIALDGSGNLYVTDLLGSRVWKLTTSGALISNWATAFTPPIDLVVDGSGNVLVVESDRWVSKYTASGTFVRSIGGIANAPGGFQSPSGIALDAGGRIYVTDGSRQRVLRFLPNGNFDMEFPTPLEPEDVAVGPDGNIYVVGSYTSSIFGPVLEYSPSGGLLGSFGSLQEAFRIVISSTGAIFVSEQFNNEVSEFQIDLSTPTVQTTLGRLKAMYR